MREFESSLLLAPVEATDAGVTGEYVDLQGFVNPGTREMKFICMAGAGSTDGTCGGYIQEADDTSGTGLAAIGTFGTLSTASPSGEIHAVVSKRYVRFVGTVATGAGMILSAAAIGQARVSP